jgi:hypothetical protein
MRSRHTRRYSPALVPCKPRKATARDRIGIHSESKQKLRCVCANVVRGLSTWKICSKHLKGLMPHLYRMCFANKHIMERVSAVSVNGLVMRAAVRLSL